MYWPPGIIYSQAFGVPDEMLDLRRLAYRYLAHSSENTPGVSVVAPTESFSDSSPSCQFPASRWVLAEIKKDQPR